MEKYGSVVKCNKKYEYINPKHVKRHTLIRVIFQKEKKRLSLLTLCFIFVNVKFLLTHRPHRTTFEMKHFSARDELLSAIQY